jgi:hypothetical protein
VRLRNKFDLNSSLRIKNEGEFSIMLQHKHKRFRCSSGCCKYKNTKLKKKGKEARMLQLFKYSSASRSALV